MYITSGGIYISRHKPSYVVSLTTKHSSPHTWLCAIMWTYYIQFSYLYQNNCNAQFLKFIQYYSAESNCRSGTPLFLGATALFYGGTFNENPMMI